MLIIGFIHTNLPYHLSGTQFNVIKYIHNVVHHHHYPFPEDFHYPKQKLYTQYSIALYALLPPLLVIYLFCFYEHAYSRHLTLVAEKAMAPHSSTLAWKIHGRRSLVGCSPWGREKSDTTERLHFFHFLLSWIGERNGNPLQCSCLENPRDRGAWRAAISGVAQSRTRLKRLSSSSSNGKAEGLPVAKDYSEGGKPGLPIFSYMCICIYISF